MSIEGKDGKLGKLIDGGNCGIGIDKLGNEGNFISIPISGMSIEGRLGKLGKLMDGGNCGIGIDKLGNDGILHLLIAAFSSSLQSRLQNLYPYPFPP